MNTFNRVVIVILLLILIPLLSMVFVIPHSVLTNTGAWMQEWGKQLWSMRPLFRLPIGIILALLFDALAIFIIYLEVRRTERFITVQNVAGGNVTISEGSIVQQINKQLRSFPAVKKVTPQVKGNRKGVKTAIDVLVADGTDVPALASELAEVVKSVVETDLGLKLVGAPQVRIKVAASGSDKNTIKHKKSPSAAKLAPVVSQSQPAADQETPSFPEPMELPYSSDDPAEEGEL